MGKREKSKKQEIIKYYSEVSATGKIKIKDIAEKFGVSRKTVSNYLKENNIAENEKNKSYDNIVLLFYTEHRPINEIAGIVQMDLKTIRSILKNYKKDENAFEKEKLYRKNVTAEKKKEKDKTYKAAYKAREKERKKVQAKEDEIIMANLKQQQKANAISMSRKSKISDEEIVMRNKNHYTVKEDKNGHKYYSLNKEFRKIAPADLPSHLSMHKEFMQHSYVQENFAG